MALLPDSVIDPVASAIYSAYKAKYSAEPSRGYLGASAIGRKCTRALWYSLRWVKPADFSGRLYRLFQSGHLQEPRVVADLRAIGCTVYEVNPATGQQWSFSEPATGHHFRGNCDGILTGVPQAPKAPHMLEIKTSSDKLYKSMVQDGVEKSKPEHFAQMQIYMKWSIDQFGDEGCHRALYVMVNKNTDEIYTERLSYQREFAAGLIEKAKHIIDSAEPPIGISNDSTYYECKFCDYHSLCHGQDVPAPTCRSCAFATPVLTGNAAWSCGKHLAEIPEATQRTGCSSHLYIPILLSRIAQATDATDGTVSYKTPSGAGFVNGNPDIDPALISSAEIHAAQDKNILGAVESDKFIMDMRTQFGGRIVA